MHVLATEMILISSFIGSFAKKFIGRRTLNRKYKKGNKLCIVFDFASRVVCLLFLAVIDLLHGFLLLMVSADVHRYVRPCKLQQYWQQVGSVVE